MIFASNSKVLAQLNAARAVVNGACSFRLFQNDFAITPASLLGDFIESSFPGYSRTNTTGFFGAPFKVVDGRYQCESAAFEKTCTADTDEFVYGWLLWFGGTWIYAGKLPEPLPMTNGVTASIIVALQEASLSLCDC